MSKENTTSSYLDSIDTELEQTAKDLTEHDTLFIPTWDNKPPYKAPVLTLNNVSILSFQNITCIIASPGSGKSSVMESIISSVINENSDNLGFKSTAKKVLYIDFERTQLDVWNSFYRTMQRAKIQKGIDLNNIKIVSFRKVSTANERKKMIESLIKEFKPELLLLDGIGDLVDDTNSLPEAIQAKGWVRTITANYDLSIVTTLHPNKGTKNARGHIGAEILRECEGVLIIEVNDDQSRTITTDYEQGKARNSGHAEASFKWSDEFSMFIGIETVKNQSVKPENKAKLRPYEIMHETYLRILDLCYSSKEQLLRNDLLHQLDKSFKEEYGAKQSRQFCIDTITHLLDIGLIEQIGTPGTKTGFFIRKETEQPTEPTKITPTERTTEPKQNSLEL